MFKFRIREVSCPTKYFKEASSISYRRSVRYGLGVLATTIKFFLHRQGLVRSRLFERNLIEWKDGYYKRLTSDAGRP